VPQFRYRSRRWIGYHGDGVEHDGIFTQED